MRGQVHVGRGVCADRQGGIGRWGGVCVQTGI